MILTGESQHCGWTDLEHGRFRDASITELIDWEERLHWIKREMYNNARQDLPGSDYLIDCIALALDTLTTALAKRMSDAV